MTVNDDVLKCILCEAHPDTRNDAVWARIIEEYGRLYSNYYGTALWYSFNERRRLMEVNNRRRKRKQ